MLPRLGCLAHLCLPWVVVARLEGYRLRHLNGNHWLAWVGGVLSLKGARIDCLPGHVEASHAMGRGLLRSTRVSLIASCGCLELLCWLVSVVQLPIAIPTVVLLQTLQLFLSLSWLEK